MTPADARLFWSAHPLRLKAGRERATGRLVFPAPADDGRFEAVPLGGDGRVWSWTVQRFRPKSPPYVGPEAFAPFALAYVDLGDILVESRLVGFAFDALAVGLPCRLVAEDWGGRRGFAFAPAEAAA